MNYYCDSDLEYEEYLKDKERAIRQRKNDGVFAVCQSTDFDAKYMKRCVLSAELKLCELDLWLRDLQKDEPNNQWKGRIIVDFTENEICIYNYYVE